MTAIELSFRRGGQNRHASTDILPSSLAALRQVLAELHPKSPIFISEAQSLAQESDTGLLFEGIANFARRIQQSGDVESSAFLLNALLEVSHQHSTQSLPGAQIARIQAELDAILGRGRFAPRAEFLMQRFAQQATDLRTIIPMMAGSMVGQIAKTWILGTMASSASRAWYTVGWGAKVFSNLFALGVETPAFALSSRALLELSGESPDWNSSAVAHDLASTAITLGALKSFGFFGRQIGQHTAPSNVFLQHSSAHLGSFSGMLFAHRLESMMGLRKAQEGATEFTDALSSYLALEIGGRLGRQMLGPSFSRFQSELQLRTQRLSHNPPRPQSPWSDSFRSNAWKAAFSTGSPAANFEETMRQPMLMASNKDEGPLRGSRMLAAELGRTRGEDLLADFLDTDMDINVLSTRAKLTGMIDWAANSPGYGRLFLAIQDLESLTQRNNLAQAIRKVYFERLDSPEGKSALKLYYEAIDQLSPEYSEIKEGPPALREVFSNGQNNYYIRRDALKSYDRLVSIGGVPDAEKEQGISIMLRNLQQPETESDWLIDNLHFIRRIFDYQSPSPEQRNALFAISRRLFDHPDESVRRYAILPYQYLIEEFGAEQSVIAAFCEKLRTWWGHPDASLHLHSRATSFQVMKLLHSGTPFLYPEAISTRALFFEERSQSTAIEYYMALGELFRGEDRQELATEFSSLIEMVNPEGASYRQISPEAREKIISILIRNFSKFDASGLWESLAGSISEGWGLSREDGQVFGQALYDKSGRLMKSRENWRILLRYLSDKAPVRSNILHHLLEAGGKQRDLFSAMDAVLMIPEELRDELSAKIAQSLASWPTTATSSSPGRAKRLKEYLYTELTSRLGALTRQGRSIPRRWEARPQLLSDLTENGALIIFLRAAGFMAPEGRKVLGDLLDELAKSYDFEGPLGLPFRYDRLVPLGFQASFVERWARDFQMDLAQMPQDPASLRRRVTQQAMRQIQRHSTESHPRSPYAQAIVDQVGALLRSLETENSQLSVEVENLFTIFESQFGSIRHELGERFANIRTDLRNLRQGLRGGIPLRGPHSFRISGSLLDMIKVGTVPEETCQRLTTLWDLDSNGRGQPLNRVRYGQFKTSIYEIGGHIVARRLLEVTRDTQGKPVLLAHRLYSDARFASENSFREQILSYANDELGIDASRVYFAEDGPNNVPAPIETEGEIYRDDWRETIAAENLPPQAPETQPQR